MVGGYGRSGVDTRDAAVGIGAAAVVVAVLVLARPAAHTRAALRPVGDVAETVAVVAMAPLLLGMFGVYADLLGAF